MKVFLDLDGVVADLRAGLVSAWADHVRGWHLGYPYTEGTTQPDAAFEEWVGQDERWEAGPVCTELFWATLPTYPWLHSLLRAIGRDDYTVLSNPGRQAFCAAAAAGKMTWCRRTLLLPPRRVVLAAQKHLLAGPDRLLIDDDRRNCEAWVEAGGRAALVPTPWGTPGVARPRGLAVIRSALDHAMTSPDRLCVLSAPENSPPA